jgi:hypothetical protein
MTSSRVRGDMCSVEDAIMGTVFDAGCYSTVFRREKKGIPNWGCVLEALYDLNLIWSRTTCHRRRWTMSKKVVRED